MDLERLLATWRGPLIGLFAAWGATWEEARGLAEEVFTQAWLSRQRFAGSPDDERRVGAWLRGIARNLYLSAARERARTADVDPPEPTAPEPPRAPERVEALREAVDALAPELREVVYLHYLEGSPVRDVAALLGVPTKTIEGRLYRARRELARRLSPPVHGRAARQEVES